MTKIMSGVLGLAAVITLVSGSAYALFTSQATVNGINLQTGSADLLVAIDGTFSSSENANGATAQLYPGQEASIPFRLQNAGTLPLDVVVRLTSATGDWGALKDTVQVKVEDDEGNETSWLTLAQWNEANRQLPGDDLAPEDDNKEYIVHYRMLSSVGNEAMNKALTNITFVFTGTQVNN